jgi:hypothetical protein
LLLGVVVLLSAGTVAGTVSLFGIPQPPCAGSFQTRVEFTIVANLEGYNGSKGTGGQGPFLSVQPCSMVILTLSNKDVQAHGLAVDFYASGGIEATGGNAVSIRFLAYKTGTFRVFCNTLCSVHSYMQHAQLTVMCSLSSGCG